MLLRVGVERRGWCGCVMIMMMGRDCCVGRCGVGLGRREWRLRVGKRGEAFDGVGRLDEMKGSVGGEVRRS